jgi:ribosomal protein S18 acetylase RimI-like enzyme
MELKITSAADRDILAQVARLHYESLSYRSFLSLFGEGFLQKIYEYLLKDRLGFLILAVEENNVVGFILASLDSSKITRVIYKRIYALLPRMIGAIIRHPGRLINIIETFFYSSREGTDVKPELLVIAVAESRRSSGIGAQLVAKLEETLIKQGCRMYKVTVHSEMKRTVKFYERLQMQLIKEFMLYGHRWSMYVKKLQGR